MKVLVTILGSLLIAMTAFSAQGDNTPTTPAQKLQLLQKMAAEQVKNDIRTIITLVNEDFCGGEAPNYVVEIQAKKVEKRPGANDQGPELVDVWTTVKKYAIPLAEIGNGAYGPTLIDNEMCL